MTISRQRRKIDFRFAYRWVALLTSFILGLIVALTMANDLPDKTKKVLIPDLVEVEQSDE